MIEATDPLYKEAKACNYIEEKGLDNIYRDIVSRVVEKYARKKDTAAEELYEHLHICCIAEDALLKYFYWESKQKEYNDAYKLAQELGAKLRSLVVQKEHLIDATARNEEILSKRIDDVYDFIKRIIPEYYKGTIGDRESNLYAEARRLEDILVKAFDTYIFLLIKKQKGVI